MYNLNNSNEYMIDVLSGGAASVASVNIGIDYDYNKLSPEELRKMYNNSVMYNDYLNNQVVDPQRFQNYLSSIKDIIIKYIIKEDFYNKLMQIAGYINANKDIDMKNKKNHSKIINMYTNVSRLAVEYNIPNMKQDENNFTLNCDISLTFQVLCYYYSSTKPISSIVDLENNTEIKTMIFLNYAASVLVSLIRLLQQELLNFQKKYLEIISQNEKNTIYTQNISLKSTIEKATKDLQKHLPQLSDTLNLSPIPSNIDLNQTALYVANSIDTVNKTIKYLKTRNTNTSTLKIQSKEPNTFVIENGLKYIDDNLEEKEIDIPLNPLDYQKDETFIDTCKTIYTTRKDSKKCFNLFTTNYYNYGTPNDVYIKKNLLQLIKVLGIIGYPYEQTNKINKYITDETKLKEHPQFMEMKDNPRFNDVITSLSKIAHYINENVPTLLNPKTTLVARKRRKSLAGGFNNLSDTVKLGDIIHKRNAHIINHIISGGANHSLRSDDNEIIKSTDRLIKHYENSIKLLKDNLKQKNIVLSDNTASELDRRLNTYKDASIKFKSAYKLFKDFQKVAPKNKSDIIKTNPYGLTNETMEEVLEDLKKKAEELSKTEVMNAEYQAKVSANLNMRR
jgi:hypothetical protein